jgi:hypothetical protein
MAESSLPLLGIFDDPAEADRAIAQLRSAGIADAEQAREERANTKRGE